MLSFLFLILFFYRNSQSRILKNVMNENWECLCCNINYFHYICFQCCFALFYFFVSIKIDEGKMSKSLNKCAVQYKMILCLWTKNQKTNILKHKLFHLYCFFLYHRHHHTHARRLLYKNMHSAQLKIVILWNQTMLAFLIKLFFLVVIILFQYILFLLLSVFLQLFVCYNRNER